MRITRGWAAVVLIAALTAGGCSDGGGATTADPGRSTVEGDGSAAAGTPSQDPTPTRYTDRQLGAALPRGRQQLHGVTEVATECRDLTKPCSGIRGWGLVDANADPASIRLLVSVLRTHDPSTQAEQRRQCPDGHFDQPLKWNRAHTSYTIGERGQGRSWPFSIGEWHGFVCQKTGVQLYTNGPSKRHTWQMALLTNGVHDLTTSALTLGETKALAREYLARLTVGAGLTGGG
ncbi:hypothetical protein [Nocardioides sp. T2.26MG-1]|uniref:hypothetical protein n=1 Tax=Nocardioides sp. T2.26MG-1 TaxID=3041166 RepID=UPI0024776D6A|nr:hypothetical protein [Nocardioides sp. T2.26MG-1]CAI9401606.1 hypothetical protein HIDPHFAB_00642 [Nocardioides sp. T2.26MG-1]